MMRVILALCALAGWVEAQRIITMTSPLDTLIARALEARSANDPQADDLFAKAAVEAGRVGAAHVRRARRALVEHYRRLDAETCAAVLAQRRQRLALGERLAGPARGRMPRREDLQAASRNLAECRRMDPVGAALRSNLVGVIHLRRLEVEEAARSFEEARAFLETHGFEGKAELIRANLALCDLHAGKYARAAETLRGIMERLSRDLELHDITPLATALMKALVEIGRGRDALNLVEDLLRRWPPGRHDEDRRRLVLAQGQLLLMLGRRRDAVSALDSLLGEAARDDEGLALETRRLVVGIVGWTEDVSDEHLRRWARRSRELGLVSAAWWYRWKRALLARLEGNPEKALRLLDDLLSDTPAEDDARRADLLIEKARAFLASGAVAAAAETARQVLASRPETTQGARALAILARLAARDGRFSEAARLRRRAGDIFAAGGEHVPAFRQVLRASRAALRAGEEELAIHHGEEALELLPAARRSAPTWAQGRELLARATRLLDALILRSLGEPSRPPERRRIERAFALAEKARAGALLDEVLHIEQSGHGSSRPLQVIALLERDLRRLEALLREASPEERAGIRAAIARVRSSCRELRRSRALPEGAGALPGSATLEDVESALSTGQGMLHLRGGTEHSLLFLITPGGTRVRRLPGRERLRRIVADYVSVLRARPGFGSHRGLWSLGRDLSRLLLGPFEDEVRSLETLIVVPDEIFEPLPFACLVTGPETMPERLGEIRFLGPDEGVTVTRLPGASLLQPLLRRPRFDPSRTCDDDPIILLGGDEKELPGARRELLWLQRRLEPRPLVVARDETWLEAEHDLSPPILHVAAHAVFNPDMGWPSIHLGGEGRLSPGDILTCGLSPRLAFLAACETNAAVSIQGEGLQGFARALLSMGTRDVITSAWPVHDAAGAVLSRVFYENLLRGLRPARALHVARRTLRADPAFSAPLFWGPYLHVGAP